MRIGVQAWGSAGDIRPFVALAAGLGRAGHEVHLVVTDVDRRDYRYYAGEYGFRLSQVATPVIAEVERLDEILQRCLRVNPIRQGGIILEELFLPVQEAMHAAARTLCEENELVVGHHILYPLQAEAERQNIPYASVALVPILLPSREVCPAGAPRLGRWGNRLFWWIAQKLANRIFLPHANALRRSLGLAPKHDTFKELFAGARLDLVASSSCLCARPGDWPAPIRLCGFFDLPVDAKSDQLSGELEAFLRAGAAPIFISFGSLTPAQPAQFLANLALFDEALRRGGHRAIVQLPVHDIAGLPKRADLFFTGFVSHRRVFPRCAMVIHHGGAGTTHTVARAGVPAIVIAHAADQFFWGRQCHLLGVAPAMLEMRKLTVDKLAQAIAAVSASDAMRAAAANLAHDMAAEDGVANAVRVIEAEFATDKTALSF